MQSLNENAIKIDKEFKEWLLPLTKEERNQLELSLVAEGCRDPLVLWGNTLIDGHNRYEICTQYNIPFNKVQKDFSSHEEAKNWIINNQLGRRNITSEQRDYLIGRLYKEQKKEHGGDRKSEESRGQNVPLIGTAERIAEQFKISEKTVKRAEKFVDAVDTLAGNCGEEVKQKILNRSIDISKEDVQTLAKKPVQEQKAIIQQIETGEAESFRKATASVTREVQRQKVNTIAAKNKPIDGSIGKFNIILADPAWPYNSRCSHSETRFGGGVHGQYPVMTIEEICALKVKDISADDAILFLWCTWPHLDNALKVIEAWGFEYKTCAFDWMKLNPNGEGLFFGTGYYTKSNTEYCLLATKGESMKPAVDTESMAILAPIREHSRKPEESYIRIEKMYPTLKKVELFARSQHPGWSVWGNQSDTTPSNNTNLTEESR